ncbi:amine sulfotransferase [Dryobates pubescens]|uniref:amine sulfotransferase n=1 Tax=Dryobates pubescens TaxID=118200 RepID=UPI00052128DD|nr:amine sulfotransferase [Dryobates pubescens]
MEPSKDYLFKYKGFYFGVNTTLEYVSTLEDFEINDSDVFLATYPKSGTVWTQNILSLIMFEGHRNGTENIDNMERIPWLEYNVSNRNYAELPVPRVLATHLPYYLVPRDLRNKRASVIYVTRNPKDVMVSYYHFSKYMNTLEEIPDFNLFMERFLAGKVLGSSWIDHVSGWYNHAEDFNILFLTYEEMKKDLRSAVLKICRFLGKKLSEEEVDSVVRQATFDNMKKDPRANYENLPDEFVARDKGTFLRKGTVGDWKNNMTVAQNERFDQVLMEKIKALPINFIWDINDL